ncbi:MAG: DUF4395 domain-containing protein [Actinomycetota bacterium]
MTTKGLDPRAPRFGAAITSVLMVLVIYLSLDAATITSALWIMGFAVVTFIFGVTLGPARHPYGFIYRSLVRPRLKEPSFLEDPRPVRFAQLVGLLVTGTGFVLHLLGVPYALPIAAAAAFVAAFLNATFAFCLGCLMYIGLKRIGVIR